MKSSGMLFDETNKRIMTGNTNRINKMSQSLNVLEMLKELGQFYQHPLFFKSTTLEKLSGIKTTSKTHYSEFKRTIAFLSEKHKQQGAILIKLHDLLEQTRQEILLRERTRIASDLHDSVLQILFVIMLYIDQCLEELPSFSPTLRKLILLKKLVDNTAREVRNVVYQLSSNKQKCGLTKKLENLVQYLNATGLVSIRLNVPGSEPEMPEFMSKNIYHIVQEALFNVLKHSMAREAKVNILFKEKEIELSVVDTGIGICPNIFHKLNDEEMKFGFKNMIWRIKSLKGSFEIKKPEAGGTEIRAVIPFQRG